MVEIIVTGLGGVALLIMIIARIVDVRKDKARRIKIEEIMKSEEKEL